MRAIWLKKRLNGAQGRLKSLTERLQVRRVWCVKITPMKAPLFRIEGLTKRYGSAVVVNDLSFDIAPGECLGVIGPNGAGKTPPSAGAWG